MVCFLDYITGDEIAFSIFYLIPVGFAAWYGSRSSGLLISVLGSMAWLALDISTGHENYGPAVVIWNAFVRFGSLGITSLLVSVLNKLYRNEHEMAQIDSLTGAFNHRGFYERAQVEIYRTSRYNSVFSVAYIDIDDFKKVNDNHGHHVGDRLLQSMVQAVQWNIRATDSIARIGGDEFAILLPETDEPAARQVIGKLQENLRRAMMSDGIPITFSVGVMTFNKPPEGVDDMLKLVDALMYDVKKNGKDNAKFERRI